jgi:hypothetical protein
MLEVIQQQEQMLGAEGCGQRLGERPVASLAHSQRLRDSRGHQSCLVNGGERDKDGPIGKVFRRRGGRFETQARLADAARTDECDQPDIGAV